MLYKEDWDKSKERFKALWNREIVDRCCISVMAPNKDARYPEYKKPQSYDEMVKHWTDPETILKRNVQVFENTFYGGDALPMVWLNLGPGSHAAYFGCEHTFNENTVWFEPFIKDWEKDQIVFNHRSELYRQTREIARYLSCEGKGKFLVSMPDTPSITDTLAHMRGTENLLMDFVLEPEHVKRTMEKIKDPWLLTNDVIYEITRECNEGGSCIGWLNTWAPGKHYHIQCDLSVMTSNEIFEEFVMDELKVACQTMDHSLYHLDGQEQVRHLDSLLSIKELDMIQWTCVHGQPDPTEFIPVLRRIQEAGKGLLISPRADLVETLLTELSSKGLYLVTWVPNEDDARDLVKLAEKLTHD